MERWSLIFVSSFQLMLSSISPAVFSYMLYTRDGPEMNVFGVKILVNFQKN